MSQQEILAQVASGKLSIDDAGKLLAETQGKGRGPRKTAKGTVWYPLGYKVEKGKGETNSITLPRRGFEKIIADVKSGAIESMLKEWDKIPLSASASRAA
jgi:hypothetical protein